jgi:hypothetical protein
VNEIKRRAMPKRKHATVASDQYTSRKAKMSQDLCDLIADIPRVPFKPLRQWPAVEHPRQGEINEFRNMPSLVRDEPKPAAPARKTRTLWV